MQRVLLTSALGFHCAPPPYARMAIASVRSHAVATSAPFDDGPFAVAPMMDYTNQFLRFMLRRISARATLYTEMVTANTLVHCAPSELERFLAHEGAASSPSVLQVGGADPELLRKAAEIAAPWGYDAINLNCGCPSDRVAGSGAFGAALMRRPELVADCCRGLADGAPGIPITIKCRIGVTSDRSKAAEVDDEAVYAELHKFVETVSSQGGVSFFAVHARRAVLGGLSPDQNRKVPPLRYGLVNRLADDFPALRFSLNGGLTTLDSVEDLLGDETHQLAGVMVGRAAISTPWAWATVDRRLYGASTNAAPNRRWLLEEYGAFADCREAKIPQKVRRILLAPVFNLFAGEPYGKKFRAKLDAYASDVSRPISDIVLASAQETLLPETLDAPPGALWDHHARCYHLLADPSAGTDGPAVDLAAGLAGSS